MKWTNIITDTIPQYLDRVAKDEFTGLNCVSFATNFYKELYSRDLLQEILSEFGIAHIDLNNHLNLLQAYINCKGQEGRIKFLKKNGFRQLSNNLEALRGDVVLIEETPNIGLVCDGKVYVYSALGLASSPLKNDKRFMVFTLKEDN